METRLSIQMELGMREVRECSAYSGQFGLVLKEPEIRELVECRQEALVDTGRVEFGGGILPKLIHALCDSPYIDQETHDIPRTHGIWCDATIVRYLADERYTGTCIIGNNGLKTVGSWGILKK